MLLGRGLLPLRGVQGIEEEFKRLVALGATELSLIENPRVKASEVL